MEAIILAGGFGTRLRHIVPDVPKPMVPINGEPFLKYIFEYLLKNEITHVVLAVGYKAECIKNYFGDKYKEISIDYSVEDTPLGTGGAIKKALRFCTEEDVFVLNGDTYFNINLNMMKEFHCKHLGKLTIAVKSLNNFERYGSVIIKNNIIEKFMEKKHTAHGKINGGVYCLKKEVLILIEHISFSFEKMILENGLVDIYAYDNEGYFIDIGIPEDYYQAQKDLFLYHETLHMKPEGATPYNGSSY